VTRAAVLKLLGAAAGLAIVVTLISPPTRPVPTPAGDWRKQLPVKTGVSPPAASTATVPAAALARRSPPVQPKIAEEMQPAMVPDDDDRVAPDDLVARRFRQGYHWAERNGVDDERDCFRQPGDPFTDGCLAALTNRDRSFGYGPAAGRFRRDRWGR
jgi:hypothetical protein